jgi:hypothetical protein
MKIPRDKNRIPLARDFFVTQKTVTFAGGTANAIGDYDGTGNPTTVFSVTGAVLVKVFAVCTTNLTGTSATLTLGTAGAGAAGLIASTTATDLIANEIWVDATPTTFVEPVASAGEFIIGNGQDIVLTVGTANVTAGVLEFYCLWKPIGETGLVE